MCTREETQEEEEEEEGSGACRTDTTYLDVSRCVVLRNADERPRQRLLPLDRHPLVTESEHRRPLEEVAHHHKAPNHADRHDAHLNVTT